MLRRWGETGAEVAEDGVRPARREKGGWGRTGGGKEMARRRQPAGEASAKGEEGTGEMVGAEGEEGEKRGRRGRCGTCREGRDH